MCTIFTDFEYPVKKLKRELLFLFQTKALNVMGEILKMNTIHDYHEFLGVKTLHPLVSVIDLSEVPPVRLARKNFGFYTVFSERCQVRGSSLWTQDVRLPGRYFSFYRTRSNRTRDDDNGTRVQVKGWALLFHPDLLLGTSLGRKMKDYSFFSYEANEALHMSDREREIVINCFQEIREELEHAIDKHSRSIITANIEVFLNHCVRFYDRQFITRKDVNKDILTRFEDLLNGYFESDAPVSYGLPSVAFCADKLNLSANYFGDLIKKETGKSAQEYIQFTIIEKVKERFADSSKSVSEIAYEMGFKYPHHLSRLFKKMEGCSPNEYRVALN